MDYGKPTSAKTTSHLATLSCAATFTVSAHFLLSGTTISFFETKDGRHAHHLACRPGYGRLARIDVEITGNQRMVPMGRSLLKLGRLVIGVRPGTVPNRPGQVLGPVPFGRERAAPVRAGVPG